MEHNSVVSEYLNHSAKLYIFSEVRKSEENFKVVHAEDAAVADAAALAGCEQLDVAPQAGAVADLSVETLAGCEGFVFLYEGENVERHLIVASPGNIREAVVYDSRHNIHVLAEHGLRVDGEGGTSVEAGQLPHGAEI